MGISVYLDTNILCIWAGFLLFGLLILFFFCLFLYFYFFKESSFYSPLHQTHFYCKIFCGPQFLILQRTQVFFSYFGWREIPRTEQWAKLLCFPRMWRALTPLPAHRISIPAAGRRFPLVSDVGLTETLSKFLSGFALEISVPLFRLGFDERCWHLLQIKITFKVPSFWAFP